MTRRLVHGGESAVKALTAGVPFTGLAAKAEQNVIDTLADEGRAVIVQRTAVRLQTAADLYWSSVVAAADAGDLKALDTACKRFGWLAGHALRSWAEVRQEEKARGPADLIVDAVRAAKDARHEDI